MIFERSAGLLDQVMGKAMSCANDRGAGAPANYCLPEIRPEGLGLKATLDALAPLVLNGARDLGAPGVFAHMDPPTAPVTWATAFWNALLNQNLLHGDTAPAARIIEEALLKELSALYGMSWAQIVPDSSLANLEALWAARENAGVTEVVASSAAHVSVQKSAAILGLSFRTVAVDRLQRIHATELGDLRRSALVLTAGTTSSGAIDDLRAGREAAWRHVDAAWAGPLRLSSRHASLLNGIEEADSVTISAHKWLFQPKECALVFFRDRASIDAITFSSGYLAAPIVGLMGSRGASAISLYATLLAYGTNGIARTIEHCMLLADRLAHYIEGDPRLELFAPPTTGCVLWRVQGVDSKTVRSRLRDALVSTTSIEGETWLRSVAANPYANPRLIVDSVLKASEM